MKGLKRLKIKHINFEVETELHKKVRDHCSIKDTTIKAFIVGMLEKFFEENNKKVYTAKTFGREKCYGRESK